jgi:outer membrane receptor protein involved in Fe transport
MKFKITFLICFCTYSQVYGANISGKLVVYSTKDPIEFAQISILNSTDNKLIAGVITDKSGDFSFKELIPGIYRLRANCLGYSTIELPIVLDSKHPIINLGKIEMAEITQNLKQVEVIGRKAQVRFEIDRKVFNVDQSLASAGASATELLRNIPSVEVAADGNILLRNNKNVIIWINGRPSGLNEDNRTQVLEQIPAETIERVEIISNPSAKYSPEGSAGIINIVLKKVNKNGRYGSATIGSDTNWSRNAAINFYYSNPKWDVNVNAGYRNDVKNMFFNSDRWTFNPLATDTIVRYSRDKVKMNGDGFFVRGNATYHISAKDHLNLSTMATTAQRYVSEKIGNQRINQGVESVDYRYSMSNVNRNLLNISLDYMHEFAKKGHEIKASIEQNMSESTGDLEVHQMDSLFATRYYQWGQSGAKRSETNFQLDYSYPISDNSKLELGYKGEFQTRDNTTVAEYSLTKENRTPQHELDNLFGGSDNRNSLYVNYSGKYGKLTYQAGLRTEYNIMKNRSTMYDKSGKDTTSLFDNNYPGLYPSIFLDYELPANNKLQLNYTRRINRPKGRMMNPFINVADSANIEFGNPNLTPEYTNSFELNHIKMWDEHMLSSLLYYRNTNDVIQGVNYVQTVGTYDIKYITSKNITNSQSGGFELMAKNKLFKILDLTSTLNLFYNHLDGFDYAGTQYASSESLGWSGRIIANIALPAGIMSQVSGGYLSRRNIAQGESLPTWGIDAGLRKTFFDKKLMVNLTARDILNTRINKDITSGNNFYDYSESQYNARMLGLVLTYNFGNQAKKSVKVKENDTNPLNGDF